MVSANREKLGAWLESGVEDGGTGMLFVAVRNLNGIAEDVGCWRGCLGGCGRRRGCRGGRGCPGSWGGPRGGWGRRHASAGDAHENSAGIRPFW